jgi:hypothetical protein
MMTDFAMATLDRMTARRAPVRVEPIDAKLHATVGRLLGQLGTINARIGR